MAASSWAIWSAFAIGEGSEVGCWDLDGLERVLVVEEGVVEDAGEEDLACPLDVREDLEGVWEYAELSVSIEDERRRLRAIRL